MQKAVTDGKGHATSITNSILSQTHVPSLKLGVLASIPNIDQAAINKLLERQLASFSLLQQCLDRLESSIEFLSAAVASVSSLLEETPDNIQTMPVFSATLTLEMTAKLLEDIERMYTAELEAKRAVIVGFDGCIEICRQQPEELSRQLDRFKSSLQVYITSWMLNACIDDERVESSMKLISKEAFM